MKVGDLVTLSAYGKKVKRAGWVRDGDVGVIKEIRGAPLWASYRIFWSSSTINGRAKRDYATRGAYWDWSLQFDRRDIKFLKLKS